MKQIELLDAALLDATSAQAQHSPRRRMNHNLHTPASQAANRLLNAVEPGSYIQPHRHADAAKDETFVVLRGRFGLVCFDETGTVTRTAILEPDGAIVGANIAHGTFHTIVSLAPGSVFFESKAGPYAPIEDNDRAPWAPREGEVEAAAYLAKLEKLFA